MKYNKSEIFKAAWAMKKKHSDVSFSDCLKEAWAIAKSERVDPVENVIVVDFGADFMSCDEMNTRGKIHAI